MTALIQDKFETHLLGVKGTMTLTERADGLFQKQVFNSVARYTPEKWGFKPRSYIRVDIRFDDQCNNGHQTFAITGSVYEPGESDISEGGCIHDYIAERFPEFAPLIQWHLCSTDGPMHYPGNATYLAGDMDCWGRRKGQPLHYHEGIRVGNSPIVVRLGDGFLKWLKAALEFNRTTLKSNPDYVHFEIVEVPAPKNDTNTYEYGPNYTFKGFNVSWGACPFDTLAEAEAFKQAMSLPIEFTRYPFAFSKGKERDLEAARRSAVWPDATDEQLCLPKSELHNLLMGRLPGLITRFHAQMDACGFIWREKVVTVTK